EVEQDRRRAAVGSVGLQQVAGGGGLRPGHRPRAAHDDEPHVTTRGISPVISAALCAPTSGPRKRRASRSNAAGSPVARKEELGVLAGPAWRWWATSGRYAYLAV